MVVPIIGFLEHVVYDHFMESGLSGDELREKVNSRAKLFGIVDMDSNLAISSLITNEPTWKSVTWFVSVLKGGYSVHKYRQLSRFHNHRHSPKYYIPMTFYDEIRNICSEYDCISQESSHVSNSIVAKKYFG